MVRLIGCRDQFKTALRRNYVAANQGIGRDHMIYRLPWGVDFPCFFSNTTSVQHYINSAHEALEIRLASAWLEPGDLCYDVGANVGIHTVAFARAVGGKGRVIAIEASPQTFSYLAAGLRLLDLPQVTPVCCCVSNDTGVTLFYVARSTLGSPTDSMAVTLAESHNYEAIMAACCTLDQIQARTVPPEHPALVKIDVEGAEPMVFEGMRKLMNCPNPPLVIAEVHRGALATFGFSTEDILRYLPADSFNLFYIPQSLGDETPVRRFGMLYQMSSADELPMLCNIIAVPRHGSLAIRMGHFAHAFGVTT